jgi:1,2-diacylglycerol 3-beta-glucosyltransferase
VSQWVEVGLVIASLPVVVCTSYLLLLAVASVPIASPRPPDPPTLRFDVIIPAHDESAGIAATVKSLLAVDYPRALRRVIVVADNCVDDTADKARQAGALVLERRDEKLRGKGYALAFAFERCQADGQADAAVVVDADTVVSPNLLHAFAARLARGEVAVQAHYGVRNPLASWRTRLMRIALAMFHQVRSTARERLEVSCGLRGNGMCFSLALLKEVPHDAFSLVEDLEYGVRLGRAGHRVAYAGDAEVLGEMVSGEEGSRSQRHRWEHGRAQLATSLGWPLLRQGLMRRSGLLLDLAMDVLVPPLSRIALATAGLWAASLGLVAFSDAGRWALVASSFGVLGLVTYVAAGWLHSRTGLQGLLDLALAPAYVAWKLTLRARQPGGPKSDEWVRTRREKENER